jgi:uncharacterized protein (DUF58 family)
VDLPALMKLRSLELRAKVLVEGLWRGLHRSPTHGFSVEFTEYRPYSPGDDVRFLDWRLYARSDRDYVKKYEDETNLRCQLLVDQSRSMAWMGEGRAYSKADYAATFAATLAQFLFAQGDAVGVTTFTGGIEDHLPARSRPGQLRRLLHMLERTAAGRQSDLPRALGQLPTLLARRGMVVAISDFLLPLAALERPLGALRAAGHELLVIAVHDPGELTLDFDEAVRLRDLESDEVRDVEPRRVAPAYRAAMAAHLKGLAELCARLGVAHHQTLTTTALEEVLVEVVARRGRRR